MSTLDASRLQGTGQTSSSKPPKIILRSPFTPSLPCLFCRGKHWNWECTVHPSASERMAILRKLGFCAKCNHPHKALKCKKPEAKCGMCKGPHLRALCEVLYPNNPHLLPDEAHTGSSPPEQLRNTTWRRANEKNSGKQRSEKGDLEKHIADLVSNAVLERTEQLEEKIRSLESVILEQNKAEALLTEREQRVEDGELDNDLRSQTLDAHQSQLCQLKASLDEQAKSVDERERITTEWEIRLHQREKALDEYRDALDRQRREFQATSTRLQGNVHKADEEFAKILNQLLQSQTALSALQRLLAQDTVTEVPNEVLQQDFLRRGIDFTTLQRFAQYDSQQNRSEASLFASRLQLVFTQDVKNENLTTIWLKMLKSTMQYFEPMSYVADQLYKPFGPVECGLLSDADYDRNALPALSNTPKRIVRGLEQIQDAVCDGTYVAGKSSLDDIVDACKAFEFPKRLSALLGTGCKDGVSSTADGCLSVAVAKHTNYSVQAKGDLEYAFLKYIYISITVKSVCFGFIEDDAKNNIGKLVKENLAYFDDLWTGIQTFDSFPVRELLWSCPSINFEFHSSVECPRIDVNTTVHALYEAIENKLTEHGWTGRQELHKQIVNDTVRNLRSKYKKYTFYALAYLPYNQESQQCVESNSNRFVEGRLIKASQANVNVFVRYVAKVDDTDELRSKLNGTWQAISSKRPSILNNLFGSSSEKLCKRLARVLNDTAGVDLEAEDSGVGAFAAIKCGYHFVWYELAYAYFPAAATNSPYTLASEGNGKYDANCGQLILFP